MHKGLGDIIPKLNLDGYRVAVETQAMLFPEWLTMVDVLTFSPKGPSSGNVVDPLPMMEWLRDGNHTGEVCIKIVVFTPEDLDYALSVYNAMHPSLYQSFYITVGTAPYDEDEFEHDKHGDVRTISVIMGMRNMVQEILNRVEMDQESLNEKFHVGCQQHVLLWPTEEKGK